MGFKFTIASALLAAIVASNAAHACKCAHADETKADIAYKLIDLLDSSDVYRAHIAVRKLRASSETVSLDVKEVLRGKPGEKSFKHRISTSCDSSMLRWNGTSLWIFGRQPQVSRCDDNVIAPSAYVDRSLSALVGISKKKLERIDMPDKAGALAQLEEKIAYLPADAYVLRRFTQFYPDTTLVVWAPEQSVRTQDKVGRCQDDISGTARIAPWRVSIMESAGSALFYTLKLPGPDGAESFALPDPEQGRWKSMLDQGYMPPEESSAALEEYAQATQIPARLEFRADVLDHQNRCKPASMMLELYRDKIAVLSSEYNFDEIARGTSNRARLETWVPNQ